MTAVSVIKSAQQAESELKELKAQLEADDNLWYYPYYGSYGSNFEI